MRKLYRRSGIALLLAAPCVFIEALASFNSPSTLTGTLIGLTFNVFEGTLVLIALRGFYMKQAQQAGWIGTLSIIVIAAAYITLVVGAIFLIYFILNLPYTLNQVNSLTFLAQLNGIFIVVGYILLGFAIFRAGVYPSWTGVTIIALGLYNVIPTLINFLAPTQQSTAALTFEGFLSGMANLILGVLYVRWSIALLKK